MFTIAFPPSNSRRRGVARWLALPVALSVSLAAAGEPTAAKQDPIRAKLQAFVDQQKISGGVVVAGRGDGILYYDAVGLRDIDAKLPVAKNTIFRLASITKPITSVGVMILVDEGRLTIDDPVEKHLKEFRGQMLVAHRNGDTVVLKKPSRPITVRDLMTHTSGLMPRKPDGLAGLQKTPKLSEAAIIASQQPLEFEPGSQFAYCNQNIDTLGRLIEVLSGEPYETFMQKRIFTPLGMTDTTFFPTAEQLSRVAVVYQHKAGKLEVPPAMAAGAPAVARYPSAAGGLYSTGADLARLCRMMLGQGRLDGQRILSITAVRAMTAVHTGELAAGHEPGLGWGLGWFVVRWPERSTVMFLPGAYGHGGAYGPQIVVSPPQDLFVILLVARWDMSNPEAAEVRGGLQAAAVAALGKR